MDRIVKTGRRNLAVVSRQLFAQGMAVVAVGAGRTEHGGQGADIGLGLGSCLEPDGQGQFDDAAGAAAFGWRQDVRRRQYGSG